MSTHRPQLGLAVYFYLVPKGQNGAIEVGMTPFRTSDGDLAAELEGARCVIESRFLAAGEILVRSIEGIDALIASLDNLVKALDENAVADTTKDMRVAAETLLGLADNHRERQRAMDLLGRHREILAAHVGDMRSSLAYMRAFTVNIKIVSSGIAKADATFESFAQEISDCIESGREQMFQIETDIGNLKGGLAAAYDESVRLASHLGTLLPALPNQLGESAGMMAQHYSRVLRTADEVAGIARNIHKHVARVLQALQIGDRTRQRIEHVQAGLKFFAHQSDCRDERFVALGHALLMRQLAATKAEFDQEVGEIEHAMANMADQSRELLKLRDMAYGSDGENGQGFLDDLLAHIEEALVLVAEIEGAESAVIKTGRDTAAAAAHLDTRISAIQSLKNDVQYMALNTTIRCAQIGEVARPLSVIAVELRGHGRHLESAAAGGLAELGELTAAAGILASAGQANCGLSAAEALGIAARLIREASQRTENEIGVLVSRGEEVLSILDESVERLALVTEIGGKLDTVAEHLAATAAVDPYDAAEFAAPLAEFLASVHALYTMKQERDVHQAFVHWLGFERAHADVPADSVFAA